MKTVVDIATWRTDKTAALAQIAKLECPQCDAMTSGIKVDADGATAYRCAEGHRPITWRIDADGNMLRGLVGRRYY